MNLIVCGLICGHLDPHIFLVLLLCNLILTFMACTIPFIPPFVKVLRLDLILRESYILLTHPVESLVRDFMVIYAI